MKIRNRVPRPIDTLTAPGAPRVGRVMLEVKAEAAGTEREMLTAEQDGIARSLAFWKDWTAKRGLR